MLNRLLRRDALMLILLLALVTLLALPVLTYPLGRDQGEFATVGRGILDGRIPYKELWNPKPPAVFYVYALAIRLFGQTTVGIRLIDIIIVPVISAALYWLGKHIANRRVGLWTALIFPVFYFTETFWTLSQNDGIALLPMTLAMVCLVKAVSHQPSAIGPKSQVVSRKSEAESLLFPFLAGALCAYVVWFKYPFALFGVALMAGWFLFRKGFPTIAVTAAFVAGAALVTAGGILYLMSIGAWDELLLSARVTAQYTALTFNTQELIPLMQTALSYRWQQWGLLWLLAAAWFFVGRWGEKRGRGWLVIVLWALTGLAIMLVQAKGYDYHWLPMLPPLALLAADSLDRLLARLSSFLETRYSLPGTLSAIVFLAILTGTIWPTALPYLTDQEDQVAYFSHFVAGEFVADESLKVANFLREREVPGDSLYIWGFRPEVYYMSGLNPATRFIFQFPLVGNWYPPEWKKENVDILWAALPPYVLVLQVDYMPWVTGSHEDSNTLLQEYTDLNNWLIFNYDRDRQIGNFFIWKRKR